MKTLITICSLLLISAANAQVNVTNATPTPIAPFTEKVEVTIEEEKVTTQLANTGGEPYLMFLAGIALASGAYVVRKFA